MFTKVQLLLCIFSIGFLFSAEIVLSDEEKSYLKNHPVINAHNELALPPFDFNENGQAKGFCVDYITLLASKVSLKVNFVNGYSWAEFLEMIKTDKLDILTDVVRTDERDTFIAFGPIYFRTQMTLYMHDTTQKISTLEELSGKSMAIPTGYFTKQYISEDYPGIKQVEVSNQYEALKLLSLGKVDATVGEKAAMDYLILNHSISGVKAVGFIEQDRMNSSMRLGADKKDKILIDILIKAQNVLTQTELNRLKNKWFGYTPVKKLERQTKLTDLEKKYLKQKKEIKMCVDPNWMPLEKIDKDGKYIGILSDYAKLFSSRLNVKFSLQKNR